MKAVARAHEWYERIVAGEIDTIGHLAKESGFTRTYIMRIVQCAYLSPQIVEAVITGKHRPDLSLKWILDGVPPNWREQENRLLQG